MVNDELRIRSGIKCDQARGIRSVPHLHLSLIPHGSTRSNLFFETKASSDNTGDLATPATVTTATVDFDLWRFVDGLVNDRCGYVKDIESAADVIRRFEQSTGTKHTVQYSTRNFGKTDPKGKRHKIQWDVSGKTNTVIPFDGLPFMHLGTKVLECQYGPDRNLLQKQRYAEKAKGNPSLNRRAPKQESKKLGCQARITLHELLKFPDHRVAISSKNRRNQTSAAIRTDLHKGSPLLQERRIYICLPSQDSHSGHATQEIISITKEKQLKALERAKMDLTFLGTASCFPTPRRGVSSTVFRHDGECWMFDCGEGTQIQLMKSKLTASRISKVFITHLHGDHLFGLPGMLCTMSQGTSEDQNKQVDIYGPVGLRKYLRVSLEMSRSALTFSYVVHELLPSEEDLPADWEEWHPDHEADDLYHPQELEGNNIEMDRKEGCYHLFEDKRLTVKAAPLTHRIPCFGYVIQEKTVTGRLKARYLKAKGIPPGPLYGKIKAGESVVSPDGEVIRPSEAVGPSIPGRKIVILGDTKDSFRISKIAHDADILVHEATLSNELKERCMENGHSTPAMAAAFAQSINAKSLVLFHVSQRYKPINEAAEEGEETVELLLKQASETAYTGQVVLAEDFDVITLERKDKEQSATEQSAMETETETAATS